MYTRRTFILMAAATAATAALPSCTSGSGSGAAQSRPVSDDVTGRAKVPAIRVLTKTAAEDPRRHEQARLVVESWKEAGIPAEILAVRGTEVTRRAFTSKDYDVYLVTYDPTPERLDPDNILARFISANAGESGSNVSGYRNKEFDQLYLAQRTAPTEADRLAAVTDAQKLLYEQQPARPMVHLVVAGAYRSDRWGQIEPALGYPVFNIWNSIGATPKTDKRTLVIGTIAEPPTLNPVTLETAEAQLPLSHIYDSLVRIGADGTIQNWAAQDVRVEGNTISATLRPDLLFSDGKPVTAQDVAFTIRYLTEKKSPLFEPKLQEVSDVQVSGHDIVISLAQPSTSFVATTLSQLPILPEHVWSAVPDPLTFTNDEPVSSGPFVLTGRTRGSEVRFAANQSHFSAPKIDGFVMTILGSFEAGVGALTRGDIDMIGDLQSATQLASIKDEPNVEIIEADSFGWSGLHYNMRAEPFSDRHFRRALSLLVPTADIIDVVLDGAGEEAGSVIAPTLTQWTNKSLKPFPYDLEQAMKELGDAGYVYDDAGTLYYPKDGSDRRVLDNDVPD